MRGVGMDWISVAILALETVALATVWWQLFRRWNSESGRAWAVASISLVTSAVLYQFYGLWIVSGMSTTTHEQFEASRQASLFHYAPRLWLLSFAALVPTIAWWRFSTRLALSLALGLASWMCLTYTAALVLS